MSYNIWCRTHRKPHYVLLGLEGSNFIDEFGFLKELTSITLSDKDEGQHRIMKRKDLENLKILAHKGVPCRPCSYCSVAFLCLRTLFMLWSLCLNPNGNPSNFSYLHQKQSSFRKKVNAWESSCKYFIILIDIYPKKISLLLVAKSHNTCYLSKNTFVNKYSQKEKKKFPTHKYDNTHGQQSIVVIIENSFYLFGLSPPYFLTCICIANRTNLQAVPLTYDSIQT